MTSTVPSADLKPLLLPLYRPLLWLIGGLPYGYVICLIIGLALLVATLNVHGGARWLVALAGLYFLGAVWMWPWLAGSQF